MSKFIWDGDIEVDRAEGAKALAAWVLIYMAGCVTLRREIAQMQGNETEYALCRRRLAQLQPHMAKATAMTTPPDYFDGSDRVENFIEFIAKFMED